MLTIPFRISRWIGALGLLGLLLAAFPGRVDSGPRLIEPTKTGLRLVKIEDDGLTAKFSGSTWVAGTVTAKWLTEDGEAAEGDLEMLLVPAEGTAKRLPHFARYPVTEIYVANQKEAIEKIFGAAAALRFSRKEIHSLRAKGRFLIGDYEVGVECDAPWASARILRAEIPGKRLAGEDADAGC
jgi:hypothetical protein